jgi:hypothetical protein
VSSSGLIIKSPQVLYVDSDQFTALQFAHVLSGQRRNVSQHVQTKSNDSRFERTVGADTWPGRTLPTALGLPVLSFRPLWQALFTPDNCHITENIFSL